MKPVRHFLIGLFLLVLFCCFRGTILGQSEIIRVNYEQLVSRADIILDRPVSRREAGMPVGNGTMGSLVWTTPSMMKFQINRVDVYANNAYTNSFNERDSDYGFGTGFVDIDFVKYGPEIFTQEETRQHLDVYNGLFTLEGKGVKARVLAWHAKDVMALEITDTREHLLPVTINLRMLRPPRVRTKSHLAISALDAEDKDIFLTQKFTEDYAMGSYYCGSVLAARVLGREAKVRQPDDETIQLILAPGNGTFTVLLGSASSFDPEQDLKQVVTAQMNTATDKGFGGLLSDNEAWWHDFWSRSFVNLHSGDGEADYVEKYYTYYLYIMASSSRGKYPPRFGGMIWKTGGDYCRWGAMHWYHNLSCYYRALPEAGRLDLMEPVYNMYFGMYKSCATAASQYWGTKGIWIPETVGYDGLEKLPDNIAKEVQDLYLLRKPWDLRSYEFRRFADKKQPHCSPWNWKGGGRWINGQWVYKSLHGDPFGYLVHIPTTTAKVAYLFWLKYDYTRDMDWLREKAYPMLKGTAEYFVHFPNLRKGTDGKYHIHNMNNHEPIRGCQDPMESIAAMYGILPLAIKASEMLGVDEDLRPRWKEVLENLTTMPTNDDVNSITPRKPGEPKIWTGGRKPYEGGRTNWGRLIPVNYYDLCTLENPDPEIHKIANNSFDHAFPDVGPGYPVHVLSRVNIAAALMGRKDDIRYMLPSQIRQSPEMIQRFIGKTAKEAGIMDNRMTMREGKEAIGIQRLGRASAGLQYALLQSVPAHPGEEPVIRVFPAWPEEWDADFSLAARGGFQVASSMEKGKISFVEIRSLAGETCRIRNPWGEKTTVALYRNGKKKEKMNGSLLKFKTEKGETIVLVPEGKSLDQVRKEV